MNNMRKVAAIGLTAGIAAGAVVGASEVMYRFALVRNSKLGIGKLIRKINVPGLKKSDGDASEQFSGFFSGPKEKEWFYSVSEDTYMKADDGIRLHAYWLKNPGSDSAVIINHGYTSEGKHMINYAKKFYEMGLSVLVTDARAHGMSEGNIRGMGWPERLDLIKWTDFITEQGIDKICWYGVSMGGATVLMASGEDVPPAVKSIVEDCGYTSVFDEFSAQIKGMFHLPVFPILPLAAKLAKMHTGLDLMEADALAQVKKSKIPTLFIHGSADTFVPTEMVHKLYDAAACEKEILVVDGAAHGASAGTAPKVYWNTVKEFVEKNF